MSKKSTSLKAKTDLVRETFHLPENERVIQNYSCGIKGVIGGGKLYLTQNYILYHGGTTKKVPFRKVVDVKLGRLILNKSLDIDIEDSEELILTSFFGNHCIEAFTLASYLWRNPPSYISITKIVEDQRLKEEEERVLLEQNKTRLTGSGDMGRRNSKYGGGSFNQMMVQEDERVRVDVEASERALRLAQRGNVMAMNASETLARQGETLDRIENKVENIHSKLDLTQEYVRSINSLPGYIGNSIKKRKKQMNEREDKFTDRTIQIIEQEKTMDIEILCKLSNDSLVPAVLVLKNTCFECIDPETEDLINKKFKFDYRTIAEVTMRARHEHMDIKFNDGTKRFRLMSSYLQIITNEFYLRCDGNVQIDFEEGAEEFEYNDPKISIVPPSSRKNKSTSGFSRFGSQPSTSSLLAPGADQDLIDDLDETDRHLDQISNLINNTNNIALSMNSELVRQSEQLDRINNRVDDGNERLRNQNRKIKQISDNV